MPLPDPDADWLIGVDGGGTKTHFLLCRRDGGQQFAFTGPGSYHPEIGLDGVVAVLEEGLARLFREAGIDARNVAFAFLGLPAFGENERADAALVTSVSDLLGGSPYRCDNDMVCGWAGSLAGQDGINVVAGTGSIAYGERRGRSARCGGWGELFGDEGSAYWTAIRGLNAFTRMSDGRLERGPLYDLFRTDLQLRQDYEVLERFLESDGGRKKIAGLAPLVCKAATLGDSAAHGILTKGAAYLADHVLTLTEALEFEAEETVPVSCSGGMFKPGSLFLTMFGDALEQLADRFSLREPALTPHAGAVLVAARYGGMEPDSSDLAVLREALSRPC